MAIADEETTEQATGLYERNQLVGRSLDVATAGHILLNYGQHSPPRNSVTFFTFLIFGPQVVSLHFSKKILLKTYKNEPLAFHRNSRLVAPD